MAEKNCSVFNPFIFLFFLCFLCSCSVFSRQNSPDASDPLTQKTEKKAEQSAKEQKNPYSYVFVFAENTDDIPLERKNAVISLIVKNSQLEFLKKYPVDNEFALIRRINNDLQVSEDVLKAYGYYSGKAKYTLKKDGKKYSVVITLHPGTRYRIDRIAIKYTHSTVLPEYFLKYENERESIFKKYVPYVVPKFEKEVKVDNEFAVAQDILDAVDRLAQPLKNNGYPNAKVASSAYSVNTEKKELKGTVFINQGLPATMGEVKLSGNTEVSSEYILKLCPWRKGAVWDDRYLLAYRNDLQKTGLFDSVKIEYDKKVYRKNNQEYRERRKEQKNKELALEPVELPVLLEVHEGKKRSVGGSAFYSTDQGLGLETSWEHRNFFGNGEILKLSLPLKDEELYLGADFRKPAFGFKEQSLIVRSRVGYEKTDAYNQKFAEAGVGIEREIHEKWWLESIFYADYIIPKEWQGDEYNSFMLANTLRYDARDSKKNPQKGYMTQFRLSPLYGFGGVDFSSLVAEIDVSAYFPLDDKTVFAVRGATGSMLGADASMPRGKRFFLGGGGSVRGFEHQEIGRHDNADDPLGGLSYFLFNSEIRRHITKELAIVPFVDGGMVYQDTEPDFSEELAIGAGLGVRYDTPVGPVRFDFAVPLTGAYQGDDKDITDFQIYISIGQAF